MITALISICVYYFHKIESKVDDLTNNYYNFRTDVTVIKTRLDTVENDIKNIQQQIKK